MPSVSTSEPTSKTLAQEIAKVIGKFRESPKGVPKWGPNQDTNGKLIDLVDPGTIDPVTGSGSGPII